MCLHNLQAGFLMFLKKLNTYLALSTSKQYNICYQIKGQITEKGMHENDNENFKLNSVSKNDFLQVDGMILGPPFPHRVIIVNTKFTEY